MGKVTRSNESPMSNGSKVKAADIKYFAKYVKGFIHAIWLGIMLSVERHFKNKNIISNWWPLCP